MTKKPPCKARAAKGAKMKSPMFTSPKKSRAAKGIAGTGRRAETEICRDILAGIDYFWRNGRGGENGRLAAIGGRR